MINKKIFIFLCICLISLNFKSYAQNTAFIAFKINNQIVTNIDIENEARYLIALNNELNKLDNKKIIEIAKQSIIKETIKRIELVKYFVLDQASPFLDTVIENFYLKLQLNNEEEFAEYLKKYDLTIQSVKKKIEIETTWNQFIMDKYKDQLNIDVNFLKETIASRKTSKISETYKLSEIIFEKNKDQLLEETFEKIKESIEEIGFANTANIYSLSDSAKFGGDIGWVTGESLSSKISVSIKKLEIKNYTPPIQIGNNFLILRLDDKKNENIKIDEKKELKKMIAYEQDRQLNQFSKIFFNRIKINTNISEL